MLCVLGDARVYFGSCKRLLHLLGRHGERKLEREREKEIFDQLARSHNCITSLVKLTLCYALASGRGEGTPLKCEGVSLSVCWC